jgi:hypothetical protein
MNKDKARGGVNNRVKKGIGRGRAEENYIRETFSLYSIILFALPVIKRIKIKLNVHQSKSAVRPVSYCTCACDL